MRQLLVTYLRCPITLAPLSLMIFKSEIISLNGNEEDNVIEGLLYTGDQKKLYPIIEGIPIMLPNAIPGEFIKKHNIADKFPQIDLNDFINNKWSFSSEWEIHFKHNLNRTWGWTVEDRGEQFLLEMQVNPDECRGKMLLDAGCGNGALSDYLTQYGLIVIGLDFSDSIFFAEKYRKSNNVHYVKGDLMTPPFDKDTFDFIFSEGVIHHTPSTYDTFVSVARLIKPNGKFYFWLYTKHVELYKRFYLGIVDSARAIISRLPNKYQKPLVILYAFVFWFRDKLIKNPINFSFRESVVNAYDTITPRWRYYHTPLEVSKWLFLNGFSPAVITHWDNRYGFGVMAEKKAQKRTPGFSYFIDGANETNK